MNSLRRREAQAVLAQRALNKPLERKPRHKPTVKLIAARERTFIFAKEASAKTDARAAHWAGAVMCPAEAGCLS